MTAVSEFDQVREYIFHLTDGSHKCDAALDLLPPSPLIWFCKE